jgi:YesN/AraC family two-component response regulator
MQFTLGLSGWTANDWSRMGSFDLLLNRQTTDDEIKKQVFSLLQQEYFLKIEQLIALLSKNMDLPEHTKASQAQVESALFLLIQAGKVVYDLANQYYRLRELTAKKLDFEQLSFSDPREHHANRFIQAKLVTLLNKTRSNEHTILTGQVLDNGVQHQVTLNIDNDLRLVDGCCQCHFYIKNKIYKGPCEHMLAVRKISAITNMELKH